VIERSVRARQLAPKGAMRQPGANSDEAHSLARPAAAKLGEHCASAVNCSRGRSGDEPARVLKDLAVQLSLPALRRSGRDLLCLVSNWAEPSAMPGLRRDGLR